MSVTREGEAAEVRDEGRAVPIKYMLAYMHEETRPLLHAARAASAEHGAVLVIWRNETSDPSRLLESEITNIIQEAGKETWDGFSQTSELGASTDPDCRLVAENLLRKKSKLPVDVLSLPELKRKTKDDTSFCVGKLGTGPITHIVVQSTEMGTQGDLLLKQNRDIMESLQEAGIFEGRSLVLQSYGAGGSTHEDVSPGTIVTSSAVLDVRVHVDPLPLLAHLKQKVHDVLTEGRFTPVEKQVQLLSSFMGDFQKELIRSRAVLTTTRELLHERIAEEPGNLALVAQMTACNDRLRDIGFSEQQADMVLDQLDRAFDSGEIRNLQLLECAARALDLGAIPATVEQEIRRLVTTTAGQTPLISRDAHTLVRSIDALSVHYQRENRDYDTLEVIDKIERLAAEASRILKRPMSELVGGEGYTKRYYGEVSLYAPDGGRSVIYRTDSYESVVEAQSVTRAAYHRLGKQSVAETVEFAAHEIGGEGAEERARHYVDQINNGYFLTNIQSDYLQHGNPDLTALEQARAHLREFIEKEQAKSEPGEEFSLVACCGFFLKELDKQAGKEFGSKMCEMEFGPVLELLYDQLLDPSIRHEGWVIGKVAADPSAIPEDVTAALNTWAETASYSLDDYVDAVVWGLDGFDMRAVPESARWGAAEALITDHPKIFYEYEAGKVMNPYWREVSTDLLSEIKSGAAFGLKPADVARLDDRDPQKRMMRLAADLLNKRPVVREEIGKLVGQFLTMHRPSLECEGRGFKVYARGNKTVEPQADWDRSLYVSSNFPLLVKSYREFDQQKVSKLGGGLAIVPSGFFSGAVLPTILSFKLNADEASPQNVLVEINKMMKNATRVVMAVNAADGYLKWLDDGSSHARLKTQWSSSPEARDAIRELQKIVKSYALTIDGPSVEMGHRR